MGRFFIFFFIKTIFLRLFNLGKCNPDNDWKQSRDCGNISVWVDSAGGIATDQIPRINIDLAIRLSENDIRTEDELRKSFTGKINELLLNDFMNKYKKPFETYPLTTFEQNSRGEISISKVDAEWLEAVGNLRPTDYGSVKEKAKDEKIIIYKILIYFDYLLETDSGVKSRLNGGRNDREINLIEEKVRE